MITCWFHKKIINRALDAGVELPAKAQQHLQNCPACRQHHQFHVRLSQRLVAEAELHRTTPSPFLHGKIMAALKRRPSAQQSQRKSPAPIWATASVILLLGLLSIPLLHNPKHSPGQGPSSQAKSHAPSPLANQASDSAGRNLLEWSKALDQPLESEMQSVMSDAKTAIHLLAQNFLPEDPQRSP